MTFFNRLVTPSPLFNSLNKACRAELSASDAEGPVLDKPAKMSAGGGGGGAGGPDFGFPVGALLTGALVIGPLAGGNVPGFEFQIRPVV